MKDITEALAALRAPAPAGLESEILAGAGLADRYTTRPGPIGTLYVAFNEHGVSCVDTAPNGADFEERFAARFGRPAVPAADVPARLTTRIDRAIARGRPGDLELDRRGITEFQAAVLDKTAEIPRSEVRPYGWIAREIGRPGAVRAVGSALAANPVPLIVPCHRVVRSDGTFGDYSLGGPGHKPLLLAEEGLDVAGYRALARRGVRYVGSDTTGVYCHPTCRHARRIHTTHRLEFRSARDAIRAGFRPCRVCRPAAA